VGETTVRRPAGKYGLTPAELAEHIQKLEEFERTLRHGFASTDELQPVIPWLVEKDIRSMFSWQAVQPFKKVEVDTVIVLIRKQLRLLKEDLARVTGNQPS
jgi:hypothetical protein